MVHLPPSPPAGIVGVVLAGGASRRMGFDKRFAPLAGRPLVARVVGRLAPQVDTVALALDRDAARRLAAPGAWADLAGMDGCVAPALLVDAGDERAGPLAGLLAGLRWAAGRGGAARIVTTPVDTPFLPHDLVAGLAAAAAGNEIAVACSHGRRHPATALVPTVLADDLAGFLAAGERRVGAWLARHAVRDVHFPATQVAGHAVDPLQNLNTPEDLAAATLLVTSGRAPP